MPRVKKKQAQDGCHVTGQIYGGRANIQVTVTLERACTWQGRLVPMRFEAITDERGHFEMRLPPTSEMQARDGGSTPLYQFTAEQIGSWQFAVPAQEAWSLG